MHQKLLSPRDVAEAIGASESSLKRWVDEGRIEAHRTAGGHRRIALGEAVRFIRETGAAVVRPDLLGMADLGSAPLPSSGEDDAASLFEFLRHGKAAEARALLLSLYLRGDSVAAICDGPLTGALSQIGELWRHSETGIFHEHRATDICIQALHQLRLLIADPPDAPTIVGGAPESDPYLIPSLMAAASLADAGFRAVNLGARTPNNTLVQAAEHHRARLVWLSVSWVTEERTLPRDVTALAEALESRGVSLIVGGRCVDSLRGLRRANVHIGASMAELVAYARGLLAAGV